MLFSVILATLNRSKELEDCLNSLAKQEYADFEIVIIDQSDDNLTENVVEKFNMLSIQYHHVDFKGLSKARNYGARYAKGTYCCLVDDDAIYTPEYLKTAKRLIDKYGEIVLSGVILSITDHRTPFVKYKSLKNCCKMKTYDIVSRCPSAALVFPTKAFLLCGGFNERLGVGNRYASGEETDFLLRLVDSGFIVRFSNEMIIYHPIKPTISLDNLYNHYLGKGALFKIDVYSRKKIRLIGMLLKNTIGMFIKAVILDPDNRQIYTVRKNGFIDGMRTFEI